MLQRLRQHWKEAVILSLLAVVIGVPLVLNWSRAVAASGEEDDALRLVIYTPHNEQTRYEFERAFNAWRRARGESAVAFDWRAGGGTSDLRKAVLSQFEAAARAGREDQGVGADLFFGGGDYEHGQLARGVSVERNGEQVSIPVSVPPDLPPGLWEAAFPTNDIAGEPLVHKDRRWVGTALSSFGIVYNRDVLAMLGVDEPRTWSDLTDPRLRGWVELADPAHSGSITQAYNVILRRRGWDEGWKTLRRTFANARLFTASASGVPVDVSRGEAAAGMCIDFYGRYQAGAIEGSGGDRVGYVDPPGETAATADPISILRGAPQAKLASEFVGWLLTREAQGLWQARRGTPGGVERYELRRQPIRRDVYTPERRATWADPEIDPFGEARPLAEGTPNYYGLVAPISHAMAIDVHEDLVAAWETINRTPRNDPRRARMEALFDDMPPMLRGDVMAVADRWDAKKGGDPDQKLRDQAAWTQFFRARYRQVVAMGG